MASLGKFKCMVQCHDGTQNPSLSSIHSTNLVILMDSLSPTHIPFHIVYLRCTPNHPIITHVMNCVRNTHEQHDKYMGLLSKALAISATSGWVNDVDTTMVQDLTTTSSYNDMATIRRTGPGAFTVAVMECLTRHQKEPRCEIADQYDRTVLFPPSFFYPFSNNVSMNRTCWSAWLRQAECSIIPGVTKALHLWARTWQCGGGNDETDSRVTE